MLVLGVVLASLLGTNAPAVAGPIGERINGDTPWQVAIAASQRSFPDASVNDVVLVEDDIASAAVAAALTSAAPLGAPVLVVAGEDVAASTAIETEIIRLTGGRAGTTRLGPPTLWTVGDVSALDLGSYPDVRSFTGDASAVSAAVLSQPLTGGNDSRILVAGSGDGDALVLAGVFGATHGVAVLAVGGGGLSPAQRSALNRNDAPGGGALVQEVVRMAGASTAGVTFDRSIDIEGGSVEELSLAMADLFENEAPDGLPVERAPQAILADGRDPLVAVAAANVAPQVQTQGNNPVLLLFDGVVPSDLAAACSAGSAVACRADGYPTPSIVIGPTSAAAGPGPGGGGGAPDVIDTPGNGGGALILPVTGAPVAVATTLGLLAIAAALRTLTTRTRPTESD